MCISTVFTSEIDFLCLVFSCMLGKSHSVKFLWLWKGYGVFPLMSPAKLWGGNESLLQLVMQTRMTCEAQTVRAMKVRGK